MVRYLSLVRGFRSQNEFNRLHIDLECDVEPLWLAGLAHRVATQDVPKATRAWFQRLERFDPDIFRKPQRYRRDRLAPAVNHYSWPRIAPERKQLLIAFTGTTGRLMLPLAVFLQALDARQWDVVVVKREPRETSYLSGVDGIAVDFPGVLRYLRTMTRPDRYRSLATVGTSSGGYAAIVAACELGAGRGVSIGGSIPALAPDNGPAPAEGAPATLIHVFAAGYEEDRQNAVAMQRTFGGTLRPVEGIDRHNVLYPQVQRRTLGSLIRELLPVT